MSEKELEIIIKSIEEDIAPPQGLKEEILVKILVQNNSNSNPVMTTIERLFFDKPLWAACALSTFVSGILWAIMGSGYTGILPNIIGIR